MNCLNCGAPTTPVAGRHYFLCTYCETHRDTSAEQATADGVIASLEYVAKDCPHCPSQALVIAAIDGVEVLHCTGCQGVLIGNEPFRELLLRRRQEYDGPDDRPVPLNVEEFDRRTECPQCRATMAVHPYHGPGNAILDTCFGCRLIWLDRGELAALVRAPGVRG